MKFVYLIAVCRSDKSECEIHMNTANEIPNSLHKCVEGMKLTFCRIPTVREQIVLFWEVAGSSYVTVLKIRNFDVLLQCAS